jgi:hypothetical protein
MFRYFTCTSQQGGMNSASGNLFCRLTAFFLFSGLKSAFSVQKIYFPFSSFLIPHSTFHFSLSTLHFPLFTLHFPHSINLKTHSSQLTSHHSTTQRLTTHQLTNYPKNSFSFYTYINHSVRANFYVT